jgi:hypothetical protein
LGLDKELAAEIEAFFHEHLFAACSARLLLHGEDTSMQILAIEVMLSVSVVRKSK